MKTKLLHMDDFGVETCHATVQLVTQTDDGRHDVVLDQTCFYARGGGQDWDTGIIDGFRVEEVRLDEQGVVHHTGQGTLPKVGTEAPCQVDHERRQINTRLHSAGHVVDMANSTLHPEWVPGRGAHYPHMSFVEYTNADIDEGHACSRFKNHVNATLSQSVTNTMRYVTKAELATLCRHVPDNLPENKPIRVVLYGDFAVPCGGTHVQNLSDIGTIEITKVKTKKGVTKVSYRVEGIN
jgi:Ser-tRNA(Ala) deacylase AlaX